MRIAIIDLGTNSVRFDIQQLGPGKKSKRIHREKMMVRLGQGVFLNGRLDRNAMRRTLQAFLRFKRLADRYGVSKTLAFGTSAIREVTERETFLRAIREKTGISVRVISGAEEAQLIALGILTHEKPKKGAFALVDIGGGSTEVSICRGTQVLHSASFPMGTARVQQLFLKKSPPRQEDIGRLREYIRITVYGVMMSEKWPSVDRIIGSSGTIRALAKILKNTADEETVDRKDLKDLIQKMRFMKSRELLAIPGMESKRVDMILGGAIVLEETMDALGARKVIPTEYSLRDGILEEEVRMAREGKSSHLALHFRDILEKAKLFGTDETHLKMVSRLAEDIFDGLAPVHKLRSDWKIYLSAAAVMRDTGEAISPVGHPLHSAYIIRHADFPGAESWEVEWIAELCRLHEGAKVDRKDLTFIKNKSKRAVFIKLLALLKLVDALDPGPGCAVKFKKPRISRSKILISFSGRGLTGMEHIEVEKRGAFIEDALGRSIQAIKPNARA